MTNRQHDQYDYRQTHLGPAKASQYEDEIYAAGSAHETIWLREQEFLRPVLQDHVPNRRRYLDFACGTGRILAFLAGQFDLAQGLDISESMLAIARQKRIDASLICGDLTKDPSLVGDDYDLITTFRFFLRAQHSLRREVMTLLATRLAPDGLLVFNVHNGRPSLLWLQNTIANLFKSNKVPSLSRKDVAELLDQAGMEIVDTHVAGVLLKVTHVLLRRKMWIRLDAILSRSAPLRRFGSHIIYVCRRKSTATADQ